MQELAEESIERAKETALLTDEAATARHMAETATSQVEEAERAREGMRAEMARMDTGEKKSELTEKGWKGGGGSRV